MYFREHRTESGWFQAGRIDDGVFAVTFAVMYLALLTTLVLHHEMWRDEMQVWTIAQASGSFADLLRNVAYEPHPALWYMCAWVLGKLSSDPLTLQFFHVLLACSAAYIFLRFAPMTRLHKGLFVFGFFPFYEYGAVSRCYAIGLLLTFAFLAMFRKRDKCLLLMCVTLFLLANCSAYGIFLASSFGLALILSCVIDGRSGRRWSVPVWKTLLGILTVGAGVLIAAAQILARSGVHRFAGTRMRFDLQALVRVLGSPSDVFLYHFATRAGWLPPVISGVLILAAILIFRHKPVALFTYIFGTGIMLGASYIKDLGFLWHRGHLYILFAACLWLAASFPPRKRVADDSVPAVFVGRWAGCLITGLFAYQLIPCAYASYLDFKSPFSCAKEAAEYISVHGMEHSEIAGSVDFKVSTVAGYLNKPITYVTNGVTRLGTFILWDDKRTERPVDIATLRREVSRLAAQRGTVLFVSSVPLYESQLHALNASFLASFEGAVGGHIQELWRDEEEYWLYLIRQQS